MEKIQLKVEGMSCGHCKQAVEKAVMALPGLVSAEADVAGKKLTVEYEPEKTSLEQIKEAVDEVGFSVA